MHTERWGTARLPERTREDAPRRAAEPRMLVELVDQYLRHRWQVEPARREAPHVDLGGSPRPWPRRPVRRAGRSSTIELIQRLERLERTRNQ